MTRACPSSMAVGRRQVGDRCKGPTQAAAGDMPAWPCRGRVGFVRRSGSAGQGRRLRTARDSLRSGHAVRCSTGSPPKAGWPCLGGYQPVAAFTSRPSRGAEARRGRGRCGAFRGTGCGGWWDVAYGRPREGGPRHHPRALFAGHPLRALALGPICAGSTRHRRSGQVLASEAGAERTLRPTSMPARGSTAAPPRAPHRCLCGDLARSLARRHHLPRERLSHATAVPTGIRSSCVGQIPHPPRRARVLLAA